jgi:hypothetical protein
MKYRKKPVVIDKFDPTTNQIAFGLLTQEDRNVLRSWPHGIECYLFGTWVSCAAPTLWSSDVVFRGKPAPVVTSKWFNVYPNRTLGVNWRSRKQADGCSKARGRIAVLRIDTCDGVSTAHLEEV